MTVCQDVSLPHKTLSPWLERTYLLRTTLNSALAHRYRGLWEYEFLVTESDRGCAGRARQKAAQIWCWRLTGKTIATRGVGPEARRPRTKPESILLWAFLYPPFAPLLLHFSVLAGGTEGEGHFPRGRIIHCPCSQRKQSPTQRQRSLPFSTVPRHPWKPHFNLKCPLPASPCPTPSGQGRVRVGHRGIPRVGGATVLPQRLTGCGTWGRKGGLVQLQQWDCSWTGTPLGSKT